MLPMRRTPMKLYSESSDSAQSFDDAWLTRFSGDNKDVAELHFERLKQVEVWPVLNTPPPQSHGASIGSFVRHPVAIFPDDLWAPPKRGITDARRDTATPKGREAAWGGGTSLPATPVLH